MKQTNLRSLLCLVLGLALLLAACGVGGTGTETPGEPTEAAPEDAVDTSTADEPLPEGAVSVSTVDELLSAIAPNAVIVLQEGEYNLSTASDYGAENLPGYYQWELIYGGCGLVISNVHDLRLIGRGEVSILAAPRYAEVLSFRDCWGLSLEGLTLGHTTEPGGCAAGVLSLQSCDNVQVTGCRLFGCGSMGITAFSCSAVAVRESRIDSCSSGAVSANNCRDLRLEDCALCDCGLSQDTPGGSLIFAEHCKGFALVNCEITGNRVYRLLQNQRSSQAVMLGCRVENNRVLESVFLLEGRSVTVDKCSFRLRQGDRYYENANALFAQDAEGEALISFDLDHMELARAEYAGPAEQEPAQIESVTRPDGIREVRVHTVDELLAAIAPDTCIVLEAGVYDLRDASDYGGAGGEWYSWEECYDGWFLSLYGVSGLWIQGSGAENTLISAEPRYAAVFSFHNCENLGLTGFTAGHSDAPAYCAGNVLDYDSCRNVSVENCGLFGCGVLGIWAWNCENLQIRGTKIYECSYGAASIENCDAVSFESCSIRDCDDGNDLIYVSNSSVTWNGEELAEGAQRFDREHYAGSLAQG